MSAWDIFISTPISWLQQSLELREWLTHTEIFRILNHRCNLVVVLNSPCYNRIRKTGWFIKKKRFIYFIILETRKFNTGQTHVVRVLYSNIAWQKALLWQKCMSKRSHGDKAGEAAKGKINKNPLSRLLTSYEKRTHSLSPTTHTEVPPSLNVFTQHEFWCGQITSKSLFCLHISCLQTAAIMEEWNENIKTL